MALGLDHGRILLPDKRGPGLRLTGPWAHFDALVCRRGTAVVITDVAHDARDGDQHWDGDQHRDGDSGSPGAADLPAVDTATSGAYVGVPIWVGGEVGGVLRLTDPEPRSVTVRQIRLLVEFGQLASLYLRRDPQEAVAELDRAALEIARAVREGEIVPWFQPIVELRNETVIGVEALARWRRPDGGFEQPSSFIPVAERTGLIVDLDLAVMRQAFAELARWQQVRPDFRLSVNLSGRHLDREHWLDQLLATTHELGVGPGTVDLELTETARPTDVERGWLQIDEIRSRGYAVWFDDFGAGYYDLQDLVRLSVDGIKIDRSFADQLDRPINDAVVRALTSAAAQVGLKVTIEGIETARQAEIARDLGCDFAQGFYWSRPVPAEDVRQWLSPAPARARPAP